MIKKPKSLTVGEDSALYRHKLQINIIVDRNKKELRFVFDPAKANTSNDQIAEWLASVVTKIGVASLNPEPYWDSRI